MRQVILVVFILLLAVSCSSEKPPIPIDQMANMLSDKHMAESFAQIVPVDQGGYMTKNTDTLMKMFSHIYKAYGVDTASFNQALSWYKERPKEFDKVYEKVLEVLDIRKEIVRDSIIEYSDTSKISIKDSLQE